MTSKQGSLADAVIYARCLLRQLQKLGPAPTGPAADTVRELRACCADLVEASEMPEGSITPEVMAEMVARLRQVMDAALTAAVMDAESTGAAGAVH